MFTSLLIAAALGQFYSTSGDVSPAISQSLRSYPQSCPGGVCPSPTIYRGYTMPTSTPAPQSVRGWYYVTLNGQTQVVWGYPDGGMIRYNAAHPGAEKDIFPHLGTRQPSVVAYTATSWRALLRTPRSWTERPATAGDCYRFCLSSPHVDVVLTGPKTEAELDENLAALEKGPLSAEEDAWIRRLGVAVR